MVLSVFPYICISNNPDLVNSVNQLEIVDGTALAVLTIGRDLIHLGWELVANPLYGNFKPNQQPYRTIVLKKNNSTDSAATHFDSLNLIEEAINIYRSSHILRIPGELRERIDKDFRYLDFSLMEETFCQCGLLCSVLQRTATGG